MSELSLFSLRLSRFPKPAKALVLGYVGALALAYVYALANIALVVGLTPEDIAIHYYGSAVEIQEAAIQPSGDMPASSGEAEFSLDNLEEAPLTQPVVRPSLKNLVAEGHFHLFGMTSFFFGLTVLGLFLSVSERVKVWLVSLPYVFVVVDNLSFMATRFIGPKLAFLTATAGGLMAMSFTVLWVLIVREVLCKKPSY